MAITPRPKEKPTGCLMRVEFALLLAASLIGAVGLVALVVG